MPVVLNRKISKKEMMILHFLYKVRGATNIQIVKGLGYVLTVSNEKNMYKPLNKLIKENLVDFIFLKTDERRFYFLSEEGFEFMKRILDVKPFHYGTGYNKDFGDFDYKLHKPPTLQSRHFVMQVDSIIEIENLKKMDIQVNGHFNLDYRDNRYCSTRFELKKDDGSIVHCIFKPDGELMFSTFDSEGTLTSTNVYSIEVDTGSERKSKLLNKFETYKQYFDYLTAYNKPLPKGILFIGDVKEHQIGLESRWATLTDAFNQALGTYSDRVNLHYVTMDNLKPLLYREILYKTETPKILKRISTSVLANPNFKGDSMFYFGKRILRYDGFMPVTMYEPPVGKSVLYCYIRVDSFETMGWYELRRFLEYFETEKSMVERYAKYKRVIPVVYFFNKPGPIIEPKFFKNYPSLKIDELIYYDAKNELWFNQKMQQLSTLPLPRK